MRDTYHDLETRSPTSLKHGSHKYAEKARVLIWTWADGDGPVGTWDLTSGAPMPADLGAIIDDDEALIYFHNGGQFDFVILEHALPEVAMRIPTERRRDTMVQAYCHGLPGALHTLGEVLKLPQDKRKGTEGRRLMRLFCIPDKAGHFETPATRPEEWKQFLVYAGQDIQTMREVHRKVPMWNYKGAQLALWHLDLKINSRGASVDQDLARAAVRAASSSLASLAKETVEITDGALASTTQRDAMLAYVLADHGVNLPDMKADTLERRMNDPNLPQAVRDLFAIRLQASMNSASKYTALLNGVSSDGRLRGMAQFRGASRTGRWAHRLFQPGNLMRPPVEVIAAWHGIDKAAIKDHHIHDFINLGIDAMLAGTETWTHGTNVRALAGAAVRGCIVAPPGKKLCIADLSSIEGRVAAWLAGEEWELAAFRAYDAGEGPDAYKLNYAKSFNVRPEDVNKEMRQIGKVEVLMFQYQGGVGAWITGAATYGIDLEAMTEAVWDVLPAGEKEEAQGFLSWLYSSAQAAYDKAMSEGFDTDGKWAALLDARKLKARYGLSEKTFVACDAIKRLWRKAHPAISSYWKELENVVRAAIASPGVTLPSRKLQIRRDGAWLRIRLPSGRCLCYFSPKVADDGTISFVGMNPYTHQWGETKTYGGKLFENCIAEGTPVLTEEGWVPIERVSRAARVWDGVDWVNHGGCIYRGKQVTIPTFGVDMTSDHRVLTTKGWRHASSCEGLDRADCRLPDGYEVPRQRRAKIVVGSDLRLRQNGDPRRDRVSQAEKPRDHGFVRLHEESHHRGKEHEARHVGVPRVLGLAVDACSVREPEKSSLSQLRWAWLAGVRKVAQVFRGFLGRHGADLLPGVDAGTRKKFARLLAPELCLGHIKAASAQHALQPSNRHTQGANVGDRSIRGFGRRGDDAAVPGRRQVARESPLRPPRPPQPVWDILNCGPRQRFVVKGVDGLPLIVHNCVQAVACDQMAECLPIIEDAGYEVAGFTVHDEVPTEVPDTDEFTHEALATMMCSPLDWNQGLPLAAAGFTTKRYYKG